MEEVILVDNDDNEIGTEEKLSAHKNGHLHRAFSIFIFNTEGELLIHKRASNKYHSSEKWTNTCCSHPRPEEKTIDAANRRLMEEMGLVSDLTYLLHFIYKAKFDNGLIEHELDHVYVGHSNQLPILNDAEASEFKYISPDLLLTHVEENPEQYTIWFRKILGKVLAKTSFTK